MLAPRLLGLAPGPLQLLDEGLVRRLHGTEAFRELLNGRRSGAGTFGRCPDRRGWDRRAREPLRARRRALARQERPGDPNKPPAIRQPRRWSHAPGLRRLEAFRPDRPGCPGRPWPLPGVLRPLTRRTHGQPALS